MIRWQRSYTATTDSDEFTLFNQNWWADSSRRRLEQRYYRMFTSLPRSHHTFHVTHFPMFLPLVTLSSFMYFFFHSEHARDVKQDFRRAHTQLSRTLELQPGCWPWRINAMPWLKLVVNFTPMMKLQLPTVARRFLQVNRPCSIINKLHQAAKHSLWYLNSSHFSSESPDGHPYLRCNPPQSPLRFHSSGACMLRIEPRIQ